MFHCTTHIYLFFFFFFFFWIKTTYIYLSTAHTNQNSRVLILQHTYLYEVESKSIGRKILVTWDYIAIIPDKINENNLTLVLTLTTLDAKNLNTLCFLFCACHENISNIKINSNFQVRNFFIRDRRLLLEILPFKFFIYI